MVEHPLVIGSRRVLVRRKIGLVMQPSVPFGRYLGTVVIQTDLIGVVYPTIATLKLNGINTGARRCVDSPVSDSRTRNKRRIRIVDDIGASGFVVLFFFRSFYGVEKIVNVYI